MKQTMQIYTINRASIEAFLLTSISHHAHQAFNEEEMRDYFRTLPFLSEMYVIDATAHQISPTWHRNGNNESAKGSDRGHFLHRIQFDESGNYVSNPYICANTGRPKVTIARKIGEHIVVFDFDLIAILKKMHLIDSNRIITKISVTIYAGLGGSLVLLALFLGFYGLKGFLATLGDFGDQTLHQTFKSIIAITLALAIFDLAKTILEQEVFYRTLTQEIRNEYKILTKFLTSIIIALSIESLMVVFKVAIDDIRHMDYAFYLIAGVGIMITSMSILTFVSHKKKEEE